MMPHKEGSNKKTQARDLSSSAADAAERQIGTPWAIRKLIAGIKYIDRAQK